MAQPMGQGTQGRQPHHQRREWCRYWRHYRGLGVLFAGLLMPGVAPLAQPASTALPVAPTLARSLQLGVQDQQVLPLAQAPVRVLVADPAIADVQVLRSERGRAAAVMVHGLSPGQTSVQVWFAGQAAPQVTSVRVLGALELLAPPQGGLVTGVQPGAGVLAGSAETVLAYERARAGVAQAVGEGALLDVSTVQLPGVVQVEVKVAEVSRNVLKEVGLELAASNQRGTFGFGVASPGGGSSASDWSFSFGLLRGNFSLNATLNLLQRNGLMRMLAEPTLIALSGQSASFLAGGEVPIPVAGRDDVNTVEYKTFGIALTVTPTVLSRDRIALKVAPEASDVDWSNSYPIGPGVVVPSFITRRADTTVELGDGESFVIGGLVSRSTMASVDKLPLLGDLPIIGAFFRSMNYQQQEKELVIVVTPRLVRPLARGTALPLPGDGSDPRDTPGNAWGQYLVGTMGEVPLPGFSR